MRAFRKLLGARCHGGADIRLVELLATLSDGRYERDAKAATPITEQIGQAQDNRNVSSKRTIYG